MKLDIIEYSTFEKKAFFFRIKPPKIFFLFIVVCFFILISFILGAFWMPIDETITAEVQLRPITTVSNVVCISSGEIVDKFFNNNDFVNEGDLLFSLDTNANKYQLLVLRNEYNQLLETLQSNRRLLALMNYMNSDDNYNLSEIEKNDKICLEYFLLFQSEKRKIHNNELKIKRELDKPVEIQIKNEYEDLLNQAKTDEISFYSWKINYLRETKERIDSLQLQVDKIFADISSQERQIKNSQVFAPISGKIVELQSISVGEYITAGSVVLKIVPVSQSGLRAEIYITPAEIPKVSEGNQVRIRFDNLPQREYGVINTNISIIPPDVTLLGEESVFIVECDLKNNYLLSKKGKKVTLLPGVRARCKIITNRTTLMMLILRKLDFF